MTYHHYEPPNKEVVLDSNEFPIEMAKQLLIAGWNNNYSEVMHKLSALSVYRTCVYGDEGNWPTQWATVESVMNFTQRHPDRAITVEKLATLLLDHIRFFDMEK